MGLPRRSRVDIKSAAANEGGYTNPFPFRRSRKLRAHETLSEYKLWQQLRRKQIQDVRFRRQFSLGPYFVDFVCLKARLIVEVDGLTHITAQQITYDDRRTRWLSQQGFKVIRFWNLDVLTNLDRVVEQIDIAVERRLSTLPPLHERSELEGSL